MKTILSLISRIAGEKFGQLSLKDLVKGFVVAVLTVLLTYTMECINKNSFPMDSATWMLELKAALGAGIGYLVKQLFTNSEGKFLVAEPSKIDVK